MTPPQAQVEYGEGQSPYMHHQRAGSSDSQRSEGAMPNRQSYRQPGWGGKRSAPGPMGVTGAG
jgi:hypothetical protein